ncbi:MAG: ATP-binding protein [Kiritimatiellae bacterium]|nr:ATP-binding protein [Kiritimatiellia bacterium]
MDKIANPFSPNAGSRPPELAGRDDVFEDIRVFLGRLALKRSVQSILFTGLRGVGKTVLLNEVIHMAERQGNVLPVYLEASEDRSLGEMLASPLRMALLKIDRARGATAKVKRSLSALRNFVGTIKVKFGDVGIELEPASGLADSGDLQFDLIELLSTVAEAAADRGMGVVILVDEIQYVSASEFGALVMAMHRMQQNALPLAMVGAGLPILPGLAGEIKSYAERLFTYPVIGALTEDASIRAIRMPFTGAGVRIDDDAAELVYRRSGGYPYFIQEWGYQLWNFVERPPVTKADVETVDTVVTEQLDGNFFRVRMERLTPSERAFLRAMAEFDGPTVRMADISAALGISQRALGPRRSSLIKRGMIYSPEHGLVAFTVPLFNEFLRRNPA